MQLKRKVIGHLGALTAVVCWGVSFRAGQVLSATASPWIISAWRYTLAWLVITAGVRAAGLSSPPLPRRARYAVYLAGFLGHVGFSVCFFIGLRETPPVVAAVVSGLEPVCVWMIGALAFHKSAGFRRWAGMLLATAGALWVNAVSMPGKDAHLISLSGAGWILASASCFALYTLLIERLPAAIEPLPLLAATMRAAVPLLWAGAILELLNGEASIWPSQVGALLFFVFGVTLAAFLGWLIAVRSIGAFTTALWGNSIPIVAVLLELATGRVITRPELFGIGILLMGLAIASHPLRAPGKLAAGTNRCSLKG